MATGHRPAIGKRHPVRIGTRQFEFCERSCAARSHAAADEDPILENPEDAVAQLHQAMERIKAEMARVVIGQTDVVSQILVALFGRGHCLLVGTPGLAKTLMARTLADSLELECKRIQFTPDLMPADITGTQVLEQDPITRRTPLPVQAGPDLYQSSARG